MEHVAGANPLLARELHTGLQQLTLTYRVQAGAHSQGSIASRQSPYSYSTR